MFITHKVRFFTYTLVVFVSSLIFNLLFNASKVHAYSEDILFLDTYDSYRESWNEIHPDGDWEIIDGEYVGSAYVSMPTNPSYSIASDGSWSDYTLRLKIKGVNGVDKTVLFNYDESGNYYGINLVSEYELGKGNKLELHKNLNHNDVITMNIPYVNEKNSWYELRIDVKHDTSPLSKVTINVYINGTQVITNYTDSINPITHGSIGFFIWDGGNGDVDDTGRKRVETHYDDVIVTNYQQLLPIPIKELINKVILVPGLGASWNPDIILNCRASTPSDVWTMSPFARDIYNPIISSLQSSNWNIIPFYYDWRNHIAETTPLFTNFINQQNLRDDEKVYFIGHSLGGLVGRSYLIETPLAQNRISKYLSIGTPHKGTPYVYPILSGGKIWNDNLILKIALSLLIKRCGSFSTTNRETITDLVPVLFDLLPIYDFLRSHITDEIIPYDSISLKNTFLDKSFDSKGSQIGTISGVGFETLYTIYVKSGNKRDGLLNNWIDGRPVSREYLLEGDGTVLLMSSMLNVEANTILNQSHIGLVTSTEGINSVSNFLGPPPNPTGLRTISDYDVAYDSININSALIFISYPAASYLLSNNNIVKKSDNGVINLFNPSNNRYKFKVIPKSQNSIILVGEFLINGSYHWKEYSLKGNKSVTFTIEHNQDILNTDPLIPR